MSKLIKKILALWLIIYLTIIPPVAMAVVPSGWAMTAFNIPTSTLTAIKNGVTVAVSAAPSASTVGSYAIRFAGAAAIAYAVAKYGGSAIDWVLDPANNSVRSKDGAIAGLGGQEFCVNGQCFATLPFAGAVKCSSGFDYVRDKPPYRAQFGVVVVCKNGSLEHIDVKDTNSKTLGADEIGSDLLSKAKSGDAAAASVVNGAMGEDVKKGTHDAALDKAAAQQAADNKAHNCGTGTSWNGSACVATPTDLPALDFSSILSAIKSLGELLSAVLDKILTAIKDLVNAIVEPIVKVINDAWDWIKEKYDWWFEQWTAFKTKVFEFIDWFKSDPDPQKDNKPDIDDTQPTKSAQDFDSNYINFGGQCPSFSPTTISVGIVAVPISFNAQPLCDFAILCRPIILALAYFAAMAIVANAIRSE